MKELGEVSVLTVEHQMGAHHHKTSGEHFLQGLSGVCLGLITECRERKLMTQESELRLQK